MRQISASKRSQNVVEIAKTDYCGFGDEGDQIANINLIY